MQAVLSLVCKHCNKLLMQQKVSCEIKSSASISVDELENFAGSCCNQPNRIAKVEFQETEIVIEATP